MAEDERGPPDLRKKAMRVIVMFGVISLFGDVVYESARSVNGAYLEILGVDAAMVGIITGLAQFVGAALRFVMGYAADRNKSYWAFTIAGYCALAVVPMMALTGIWQIVALLIIMEQFAKAVRSPSRETILSQATKQVGTGWGFAVSEALDQIGATIGPLIFVGLFVFLGTTVATLQDYRTGYSLLWIPFLVLCVTVLAAYRMRSPPGEFEKETGTPPDKERLTKTFWLYCAFVFLTTMGFFSFVLVSYHLKAKNLLSDVWIPAVYIVAMLVDGLVALAAGKLYDRRKQMSGKTSGGVGVLVMIPLLAFPLPLMLFSTDLWLIVPAIVMWGAVMGINESVLKAGVADLTSLGKRGAGFGVFYTVYGLALFGGSTLAGTLYAISIPALVTMTVVVEAASIPVLWALVNRKEPS
jgi:MFS family permease